METSDRWQYPDSGCLAPATRTRELVFLVRGARLRGHLARVIATDLGADAADISSRAASTAMRAAELRRESHSRRAQLRHVSGRAVNSLACDAMPLLLLKGMLLL